MSRNTVTVTHPDGGEQTMTAAEWDEIAYQAAPGTTITIADYDGGIGLMPAQ